MLSHSGEELKNFIVGICKFIGDKIFVCEVKAMQNDWRMKNVSNCRFIVMPHATATAAIQRRRCLSDSIPESESVIHVSSEVVHHDVRYGTYHHND